MSKPPRWHPVALPCDNRLAAATGTLTHQVIAELCRVTRGVDATSPIGPDWLWETAGRFARTHGLAFQMRGACLQAVSHAAVFRDRLMPPPGWRFLGAELEAEEAGRIDGGWLADTGLLYDELKVTARVSRGDGPTRRQAVRYAEHGERLAHELGTTFLGLRLLYLSVPRQSLLVRAGAPDTALRTSLYWFEPSVSLRSA